MKVRRSEHPVDELLGVSLEEWEPLLDNICPDWQDASDDWEWM